MFTFDTLSIRFNVQGCPNPACGVEAQSAKPQTSEPKTLNLKPMIISLVPLTRPVEKQESERDSKFFLFKSFL
jgi:hypothetical protein